MKAADTGLARRAFRTDWIAPLARPYLRGYRAVAERGGALSGYWFLTPGRAALDAKRSKTLWPATSGRRGFFAGYLLGRDGFEYLHPDPPECLVFTFVDPGSAAHNRLVRADESLLRRTFAYIRWLTHRAPRFAFHDDALASMVRHQSMRGWTPPQREHLSRNFFIETLAWLVRSGLVRELRQPVNR